METAKKYYGVISCFVTMVKTQPPLQYHMTTI